MPNIKEVEKLSTHGKYLFLAYDHGMEHGPKDFDDRTINPDFVLEIASKGEYNAVVLQKGIAEKYWKNSSYKKNLPLILKLNGKTNIFQGEPYSPQICSVEFAKKLGASAVGYTVYLGSKHENRMFKEMGQIVEDAYSFKLPVVAWMYPRGKHVGTDLTPEIITYGARVGLELGADIVKINYTGSVETFRLAVEAAGKCKIVLSGGHKVSGDEFAKIVGEAMAAGAAGVAVGRNVWQSPEPLKVTENLKKVIFGKV